MEVFPSLESPHRRDWLIQLPEDVLWKILGFLNLRTLYTARLVCKCFRRAAAGHLKALDCTAVEGLPTTDFTQFLRMTRLAVTISHESQLQSLAHPRIAPVVTHISLKDFHLQGSQTARELEGVLMHLPKLRSVSLQPKDAFLPLFPVQLEELRITGRHISPDMRWTGLGDASPLTSCSRLTSLAVDLVVGAGTSMGSLSSLRNLRSLDLCSCSSALGLLSIFTALTSLTFEQKVSTEDGAIFQDLGRLTGLSRLALSRIVMPKVVMHTDLVCIAQLTNLTCLDMSGCTLAYEVNRLTALAPLTRLVSVGFSDAKGQVNLSRRQVKALRSLTLHDVSRVSILKLATGLTHLDLSCWTPEECSSLRGLCPAVTTMSRLRSLEIRFYSAEHKCPRRRRDDDDLSRFRLDAVLRACTRLTKLHFGDGELRPERDIPACAALRHLRSLSFFGVCELTDAWLPALQAMSGLTELLLDSTFILVEDMTPDVVAAFHARRHQLGWPLLNLRVTDIEDDHVWDEWNAKRSTQEVR